MTDLDAGQAAAGQVAAAQTALPARLSRRLAAELITLSDPLGRGAPARPTPEDAELLLSQADRHGTLPAVLRRMRPVLDTEPLIAIRGRYAALFQAGVAFSMMLQSERRRILAKFQAEGVRAIPIKGQDFADHLYPDPVLRLTSDIDVIVPIQSLDAAETVAASLGFQRGPVHEKDAMERQWFHGVHKNLMLEIQSNLVHAVSLQPVMSLGFAELCPDGDPASADRASARLAIAGVHAASSHHFERLRLVVDVLQGARGLRGASEEQALEALVRRSGTRLAIVMALELAGRMFDEPRCQAIADGLRPVRFGTVAGWLIDANVVMAMETQQRALQSWRRSLFREFLKRSNGKELAPRH
jgi:hypothetical protein